MGRGRQRAKQTKVARQLKYYSPETDLAALERELTHPRRATANGDSDSPAANDDDDDDWGASPRLP